MDASLDLVVLYTEQVEACRAFYAHLGLPLVEERHGDGPLHHAAVLANGTVVEIYPGTAGRTTDRLRLAFTVAAAADLPAGTHRLEDPDGRVVIVTAR
ncbi:VOC family protein [Pseudonocardia sp. WMMC193]|uniref:VOC family protein n=1 Tax=Pseudonocardia sp. WMMC193 TaxID=2911965 RepID=UPI001F4339A6|nr:VOC family protein [Pseudonocardia sp. WMMC193]MCF7551243.1 VOC family protein [Pseudonocardia sp. WMMC193]